jgi:hypothetical protein
MSRLTDTFKRLKVFEGCAWLFEAPNDRSSSDYAVVTTPKGGEHRIDDERQISALYSLAKGFTREDHTARHADLDEHTSPREARAFDELRALLGLGHDEIRLAIHFTRDYWVNEELFTEEDGNV